MNKWSFKEYCESKDFLRKAVESTVKVYETYKLTKYCKIPIELDEEKSYIGFKPNDKIEVFIEYLTPTRPVIRKFFIVNESKEQVRPSWNNEKLLKWLESSSNKIN